MQARFNEELRLLRERKAAEVGRVQDAQARLQEIVVEASQLSAPELQAAAAASAVFTPAQAPSEDEQGPITVGVNPPSSMLRARHPSMCPGRAHICPATPSG